MAFLHESISRATGISAAVISFALSGCIWKTKAPSRPNYALAPQAQLEIGLLNRLKRNRTPLICVRTTGTREARRAIAEDLKASFASALGKWMALATQHPSWPRREENVQPVYRTLGSFDPCPVDSLVVLEGFERRSDFDRNCEGEAGCRSFTERYLDPAYETTGTIFLEPGNERGDGIIGHEVGHLLGLGDTYKEPDYIEGGAEHAPSVMNGKTMVLEDGKYVMHPSEDDREGLFAVLDALEGKLRLCRSGFVKDHPTFTIFDDLYCIPEGNAPRR